MDISTKEEMNSKEIVVRTTCASHCGGTCPIRVHVRDGVITRIEPDDGQEPQFRACLRGRAYRQRVYSPDRLKYPLKRVGARGEGKFERISWDEALNTVADQLKRVYRLHVVVGVNDHRRCTLGVEPVGVDHGVAASG